MDPGRGRPYRPAASATAAARRRQPRRVYADTDPDAGMDSDPDADMDAIMCRQGPYGWPGA
ncbi:hypothetical protein AR457_19180 [Streptomyces agglomeratus]|uniref:Uncharacterized protein n=1 Tax=Streptomyces agglomeratus TaxID=285458 RepID=A0A1E5P9M8_9ACTN|nr:hypothetical protein [Streptomyces agglomeratus]OEJ26261.1 hypothetical protein AS594_18945 [Streptomyces agglomeratus]OEJ39681.1 hypothetical protein BGK70_17470 [Streptomyces agglomeratus]OEJ45936.1 hypothetical protein AR457_19180 [Streptomyces agglomeratus]OEJ52243.1 hypothetical protein BGK72_17160 [Streptomyces agglomeratus]OEJ59600.1 hypothetical protein BGM19_18010 [Streptomyces agglomeratus]